jgi:membrane-bound lytic murein transglycosylase D
LSSIARRFKVSVDKLVEWNAGAGDKYLQPGQRLKMVVDITEQSG